jgi:dTDP-4-dehydrorhamnose 3,5-epimerase
MKVVSTCIPDVVILEPTVFGDDRGFFMETFHAAKFADAGIGAPFVQDNQSHSRRGVLRGLHYQVKHAQGKLVRVVRGEVYDVAVDLRKASPTFGQWTATYLSEENRRQIYIPPGLAHGFCTLTEVADLVYKCTDFYHPEYERTLLWNDPQLAIEWPITDPILSDKDRRGVPLGEPDAYVAIAPARRLSGGRVAGRRNRKPK